MRIRVVILAVMLSLTFMSTNGTAWAQIELRSGHFQTSDGVELHYLEAGSGPTIVFVPGWTAPAEIWEPQLNHFAASHRVVALDPRSQGRSEKPTDGHYLSRRGQDIGELIEHLDAEPVVVVGWSLAVLEVLTYAQELGSDALRAAVLVDMFIGRDLNPGDPHPLAAPWLSPFQMDRKAFTSAFVRSMYRSEQSDEYLEGIAQAMLSTPTNTAVTLVANVHPLGSGDWRPALDSLDRPVLYVSAAGNAGQAEMVRKRRVDASVEVFADAGHALFVDEPERFNRVLEEFLAALPE
ncbi:MAG: alpha/beta hydrolase [Candidatus Krumholzibacteriota bacterium]